MKEITSSRREVIPNEKSEVKERMNSKEKAKVGKSE